MLCPWADVLYAMDRIWWDKYIARAKKEFSGALFSCLPSCYSVIHAPVHHYHNSGAGVIALAAFLGVKKVIMLGYDMQHTNGKKHWHGDHPKGLANAGKVASWPARFRELKTAHPELEIINCSRVTALNCFERAELEQVLCVS